MQTFGLVHGAYHGAWCWQRLAAELEGMGHRALTVDLPCEDPSAGAAEYADAALAAFAGADENLIVVGHSLGGLTIPLIAAARPVRQLVFLEAIIPRPGLAHEEANRAEPDMILPPPDGAMYEGASGTTRFRPEAAVRWFFTDCPPELAAWAAARLRAQGLKINTEVTPLRSWPSAPCAYVLGTRDMVVNPAWARRAARSILGVEPVEIDAGHSPFLSMPALLARTLIELSELPDRAAAPRPDLV
jgi:pimeloyl-ACP methyl ester carboxylesterase